MEREEFKRYNQIVNCISSLPKRMLSLHGRDNVTDFVLHDLSHEACFNLHKVAYFVNNPDFNRLKGVSGIAQKEVPQGLWTDIWNQTEMFTTYMRNSPFNRRVRDFEECCLECAIDDDDEIIKDVAHSIGIENPVYYSLGMKHGNQGFLVFEKNYNDTVNIDKTHILNGISLLGFCPIF